MKGIVKKNGTRVIRLALIGFGNVGREFAKMVRIKSDELRHVYKMEFRVVAVVTGRHGTVHVPLHNEKEDKGNRNEKEEDAEIDLTALLRLVDQSDKAEKEWILDDSLIAKVLDNDGENSSSSSSRSFGLCADSSSSSTPLSSSQPTTATTTTESTCRLIAKLAQNNLLDAIVESTPVSYTDGQPALSILQTALEQSIHAISANKGPIAHGYPTLVSLAKKHSVSYLHESAVLDGVPVFSLWSRHTLPLARLKRFRGCLNATTTFILSFMEETMMMNNNDNHVNAEKQEGIMATTSNTTTTAAAAAATFDDALKEAQKLGIVETDPTGDVDGHDAAVKTAALLRVLVASSSSSFSSSLSTSRSNDVHENFACRVPPLEEIARDSIRNVTPDMIRRAATSTKTKTAGAGMNGEESNGGVAVGPRRYRLVSTAELVERQTTINSDDDDVGGGGGGVTAVASTAPSCSVNISSPKAVDSGDVMAGNNTPITEQQEQQRGRDASAATPTAAPLSVEGKEDCGYDDNVNPQVGPKMEWKAHVKLELLTPDDPLYNLTGASSAVEFHTDVLSPITIVSKNPTVWDTAYGLYGDLLRAFGTNGG